MLVIHQLEEYSGRRRQRVSRRSAAKTHGSARAGSRIGCFGQFLPLARARQKYVGATGPLQDPPNPQRSLVGLCRRSSIRARTPVKRRKPAIHIAAALNASYLQCEQTRQSTRASRRLSTNVSIRSKRPDTAHPWRRLSWHGEPAQTVASQPDTRRSYGGSILI